MTAPSSSTIALERLPSGIPGLDRLLGGGFFKSGVYIVHGTPGSGKTIFANQLCYHYVAHGGAAVYLTLLAESHSRMLQHIQTLSFFDPAAVPTRLAYLSAFNDLEKEGLKGLMALLRREMRTRSTGVLILDGLVAAAEAASTDRELKKFIHEVQTSAVFHNCTVFLLTSGNPQRVNAEHTMVDGIVELEERLFDARSERAIQVRKFRGSGSLRGKHAFRITDGGLEVFPRVESIYTDPPQARGDAPAVSTGSGELDALMGDGGLPSASATLLLGSSGTGKTTLGIHFLAGSTVEAPGLMLGFFESPSRLEAKARGIGLEFEALRKSGALTLMWYSQGEHLMDELAQRLLEAVERQKTRRLLIDGLSGFFESAVYPERIGRFFSCLLNELRRRGVTVLMTVETRDAVGSSVSMPYGVSGFVDNLLFLHFADERGKLRRLLTITKMRDSDYDAAVHEMRITSEGVRIAGTFTSGGDVIPTIQSAEPTVGGA